MPPQVAETPCSPGMEAARVLGLIVIRCPSYTTPFLPETLSVFSSDIVVMKLAVPIIKHFRSTTISKAFIINAVVSAVIATLIVEMRVQLGDSTSGVYTYVNDNFFVGGKTELTVAQKMRVTFITGILASLLVYNFLYVVFEFGGGMLAPSGRMSYF